MTNIAYLKRLVKETTSQAVRNGEHPALPIVVADDERGNSSHEVPVKYRDLGTGDTWTGRGRMARWLKSKQDAGEDITKYLVKPE